MSSTQVATTKDNVRVGLDDLTMNAGHVPDVVLNLRDTSIVDEIHVVKKRRVEQRQRIDHITLSLMNNGVIVNIPKMGETMRSFMGNNMRGGQYVFNQLSTALEFIRGVFGKVTTTYETQEMWDHELDMPMTERIDQKAKDPNEIVLDDIALLAVREQQAANDPVRVVMTKDEDVVEAATEAQEEIELERAASSEEVKGTAEEEGKGDA